MFLLSVSCQKNTKIDNSEEIVANVDFNSFSFDGEATYNDDIIKDAKTAKEYANIIITNTLKKDLKQYKEVTISYDSNDSIWIINYCIDYETVGGDISIAISKKTGEIKKIWFGE